MNSRLLVWPVSTLIVVGVLCVTFVFSRTPVGAEPPSPRKTEHSAILKLQTEEARLLEKYGSDHPAVQSIRKQIQAIQSLLGDSPSRPLALNAAEVLGMDKEELRRTVSLLINEVQDLRARVRRLEQARKPRIILAQSRSTEPKTEDSEVETDVVQALIEATRDSDVRVKVTAFRALQPLPKSDALLGTFRSGLKDENSLIRQISLTVLVARQGGPEDALSLLIPALSDQALVAIARGKLLEIGEPAVPPLLGAMETEAARIVVIQLLGDMKLKERRGAVLRALVSAMSDDDKAVRLAATRSIGKLARVATTRSQPDERYLRYAQGQINQYDANVDGILTEEEWSKMRRDPSRADRNADGKITADEFAKWLQSR